MSTAQGSSGTTLVDSPRDKILVAITDASQMFLQGSLETWQENVLQVISQLGGRLGMSRVFLCKNTEVTAEHVITNLRYEWIQEGNQSRIDVPSLQHINMQDAGFGRWAGILYNQDIIHARVGELPVGERSWFVSSDVGRLIVAPVFAEQRWWGFIGFENYASDSECTAAELDALSTVAVMFGAAIRRKHMEESLEREKASVEQKAREVEDVAKFPSESPSPVMRVSVGGLILYANRSAEETLGHLGVGIGVGVPVEWVDTLKHVTETGESSEIDVTIGDDVVALLFVPITESHYVNIYGRDVTHEREVSSMKSTFISMASHQLRTPLTTVRWYSELLLKNQTNLDEKSVQMAEAIHKTSMQLSELIDDLLNIGRIERGALETNFVEGDICQTLSGIMETIRMQADQKRIALNFTCHEGLPLVHHDSKLLHEIVTNLLSNAIKYTPYEGSVELGVRSEQSDRVIIWVKDTGVGIPEEDKDKIFRRFFRSQNVIDMEIQGTGLGLYVVKLMIEACGGEVWFESVEGEGTTFAFWLPIHPPISDE